MHRISTLLFHEQICADIVTGYTGFRKGSREKTLLLVCPQISDRVRGMGFQVWGLRELEAEILRMVVDVDIHDDHLLICSEESAVVNSEMVSNGMDLGKLCRLFTSSIVLGIDCRQT